MLFRAEVLEHRAERPYGDVILSARISGPMTGYARLGALVLGLIFLATSTDARVTVVAGAFVPDRGVVPIFPSKPDALKLLLVGEGQSALGTDSCAYISTEEALTTDDTRPAQILIAQEGELVADAGPLDSARERRVNFSLTKMGITKNIIMRYPETVLPAQRTSILGNVYSMGCIDIPTDT